MKKNSNKIIISKQIEPGSNYYVYFSFSDSNWWTRLTRCFSYQWESIIIYFKEDPIGWLEKACSENRNVVIHLRDSKSTNYHLLIVAYRCRSIDYSTKNKFTSPLLRYFSMRPRLKTHNIWYWDETKTHYILLLHLKCCLSY